MRLRADELLAKAMELRKAGSSFTDIADTLSISRSRAHDLVSQGMTALQAKTVDAASEWRDYLTEEHIEQMEKAKHLRDNLDPKLTEMGWGFVDKSLTQLRGLWVPALPTTQKNELTEDVKASTSGADLSELPVEKLKLLAALLAEATPTTKGE